MSHWYDKEGKLVLDATVKDARKHGLYPSVTTITHLIDNYGLNLWKQRQAALAGYTFPVSPLSDKEIVAKIIEDGKEEAGLKADKGTQLHSMVERPLLGKEINLSEYPEDIVKPFLAAKEWIHANVEHTIECEKSQVSEEHGFAGTPDALVKLKTGELTLIDWKTQGTKEDEEKLYKKFSSYPEWKWQLAACHILTGRVAEKWINVAISSNEAIIKVYDYKKEKIEEAEGIFLSILDTFKKINKLN